MKVFNSQGDVTLSDQDPSMKLTESGSVSPSTSATSTGFYRYDVTVTIPGSNKPFLFCVKSDYDKLALWEVSDYYSSGTSPIQTTISFASDDGGSKDYRLYTTFDFQSYSTSTNFGLKLFDTGGAVSYDSRVPEAILIDALNIPSTDGTITHNSVAEPWYAINMFPTDYSIGPGPTLQTNVLIARGFKQVSSTQTEISEYNLFLLAAGNTVGSQKYGGVMPIVTSIKL